MPTAYFIAGSNGAGKTTFATKFLPKYVGCLEFVNADLIAKGLSPFAPERVAIQAGRLNADVHRRFQRSLDNLFSLYLNEVDSVVLVDNSGDDAVVVADHRDGNWTVANPDIFGQIKSQANT